MKAEKGGAKSKQMRSKMRLDLRKLEQIKKSGEEHFWIPQDAQRPL